MAWIGAEPVSYAAFVLTKFRHGRNRTCALSEGLDTTFTFTFYKSLNVIASRDQDKTAQGGAGLQVDFSAQTLAITDGATSCTDASLVLTAFAPATCPTGTTSEANPQDGPTVTVFVSKQCAPCDSGYQCASGAAVACIGGTANELIGALSAADCTTCSTYTVSSRGE